MTRSNIHKYLEYLGNIRSKHFLVQLFDERKRQNVVAINTLKICTTTAVCDYYSVDGTGSSLVDHSVKSGHVMPGHILKSNNQAVFCFKYLIIIFPAALTVECGARLAMPSSWV